MATVHPGRKSRAAWVVVAAAAVSLGAIAGVMLLPGRNAPQAVPSALLESARPLITGPVANFILSPGTEPAPDVAFTDKAGNPHRLSEFRGRYVLVNIWATWCVPCKTEMPALDALQAEMSGRLVVLAISQDRTGIADVKKFFERNSLLALTIYLDQQGRSQREFAVTGLPATILVGPDGRVVGRMAGPAAWDSPEAEALLRHFTDYVAGT